MKITGNVTNVKDCGDFMEVEMQGKGAADPMWAGLYTQVLRLAANDRNKRAYWLGRNVEISITPRP